jgi:DNA-binding MarR family transcriptional regulator
MMPHENISDAEVDGWLKTLGVASLCQWDVLIFLYRHQTSLVGADFIARLLGYASDPVVAALDVLTSLGLVDRSRVSQIVRLYQFIVPSDPQRGDAWARLLALASDRAGRVRLSERLRGDDQTHQERLQAAQRFLAEAKQHVQATRQRRHTRRGGHEPWLKAI